MTTSDPGRIRTRTQSGIASSDAIAIDHPSKTMVANHTQRPPATTTSTLNNLVASSAAALCSRLCTHPLDTIKTCIQVSSKPEPILSTLTSLVRTGGLYRGLPIALTLSVPGLSVYLTAYDLTKETLAKKFSFLGTDTVLNHLSSAVVAEVSSGLFWTPMEILKSKQQVETMSPSSNYAIKHSLNASIPPSSSSTTSSARVVDATKARTGTWDLARKIYRQEGLAGFYRGYFITLGVFVPYSMIYFATYEQLKEMAWQRMAMARRSQGGLGNDALHPSSLSSPEDDVLPFTTIMGCAAVACGVAAGVSNTVDVVKTRWQTSILITSKKNIGSSGHVDSLSSARRIARHMFQQGGLASFTQGMGARVLWMIPSVTISMSVFEWIKAHGLVS